MNQPKGPARRGLFCALKVVIVYLHLKTFRASVVADSLFVRAWSGWEQSSR